LVAGICLATPTWAQDIYTRTDVREAFERIERHGDEFTKAFKTATENMSLSDAEKHVSDSVADLENSTDHLKKDYRDRHFAEAKRDRENAMLLASPINRFMLANNITPDTARAWTNLKGDLNVIASGYGIAPLPDLLPQALSSFPGPAAIVTNSADRMRTPGMFQNRIQREVRHELVMLPYYGVFDNLAYQVEGNTVVLTGQVTRPTLKSDAISASGTPATTR